MTQQGVIQCLLVATNFPISTSVVKWLAIKKALQMDTTYFVYTTYPSEAIDGPYVDGVSLTYPSHSGLVA